MLAFDVLCVCCLQQIALGVVAVLGGLVLWKVIKNDDSVSASSGPLFRVHELYRQHCTDLQSACLQIEGAARDLKGDIKGRAKDLKGEAKVCGSN